MRTARTSKKRLQGQQDCLHAVHSRPLVLKFTLVKRVKHDSGKQKANLKNVQADRASGEIHVRVIAWRVKLDSRCSVWIIWRERDGHLECQTRVNLHKQLRWPAIFVHT